MCIQSQCFLSCLYDAHRFGYYSNYSPLSVIPNKLMKHSIVHVDAFILTAMFSAILANWTAKFSEHLNRQLYTNVSNKVTMTTKEKPEGRQEPEVIQVDPIEPETPGKMIFRVCFIGHLFATLNYQESSLRKQPIFRDATTALISPRNERAHTKSILTAQIWLVLLTGRSKFSANQKHYPDLGSDVSSVSNFCIRSSDVISWGTPKVVSGNVGFFFQSTRLLLVKKARETIGNGKRRKGFSRLVPLPIAPSPFPASSETQGQIVGARESLIAKKDTVFSCHFFFFCTRLDVPLLPLSAPGSPRMLFQALGGIDLVKDLEAILTSWGPREKSQCLYVE